jgi:hypothetical protein
MRKSLLLLSIVFLIVLPVANATSLLPGSSVPASSLAYPGPANQIGFFDSIITTGTFSAHYAVQVFTDPSNVYCAGCFDFVYSVGSITSGQISDFVVGNFGGYRTSVGYFGPLAYVNPTSISRSADGQLIDFAFANPVMIGQRSNFLVVQTDATTFEFDNGDGSLTGTLQLEPIPTPEPGTLMLFGTGLAGFAGVLKRKLVS